MPVAQVCQISDAIVEALAASQVPWRGEGFPRNVITKKRYGGVNPLLLNLATARHGWKSPYWGTYSQWLSQGRKPKPRPASLKIGEWAQEIVLYKTDSSGIIDLNCHTVFNLDQIDGGFDELRRKKAPDYETAERIVVSTRAEIDFAPRKIAEYHYDADRIFLPLKEQFLTGPGGLPAYYNTVFHELAHWAEPRLSWNDDSAINELRAEMSADYLCTGLNLPALDMAKRLNHRDHIARWSEMMRQDPELIFRVASEAEKTVDFIISFNQAAAETF